MAVVINPESVTECQTFTVSTTGAPGTATQASFTYDAKPVQTLPVIAGAAGPATFTTDGTGLQTVSVIYLDAGGSIVGAENGTVNVLPRPAGTLATTLTTPAGGNTIAATTMTCSGGSLAFINGTLQYTLPSTATVNATVANGVVPLTDLGVGLTPGQVVGVSFTANAGTCSDCTFAPITVTVQSPCLVVLVPPSGTVTVGQPSPLTAFVLCNGSPVVGATVVFNGGAAPVTATTDGSGSATGSVTFNTPGVATVTATATATGTDCTCTNVASAPITVNVTGGQTSCSVVLVPVTGSVVVGQPTPMTAVVQCNGAAVAGATVTFNGGASPVTATTNGTGMATGSVTFNNAGAVPVTATATATGTACTCSNVVSLPTTVNVTAQATCTIVLHPVTAPVIVGQPTPMTASVRCNGSPVVGATVVFNGGAAPVTATTDGSGSATGSVTFNTPGVATVTATATATGTACACTNVASAPITVTVSGQTGTTLQAAAACWRVNLPFPLPNVFTATLRATVTPPTAGIPVSFYVQNQLVGTAVTDATGNATLNAGLSPLQIISPTYTAVANVGATRLQATGLLLPCIPPV
ncbi:hypothetical protein [Streptomyces sioyaensis]|uniref:hypothetical protein n=1 Tax=Streptomyces sioyaensis TaxID=67364 RepID=UPI0036E511E3